MATFLHFRQLFEGRYDSSACLNLRILITKHKHTHNDNDDSAMRNLLFYILFICIFLSFFFDCLSGGAALRCTALVWRFQNSFAFDFNSSPLYALFAYPAPFEFKFFRNEHRTSRVVPSSGTGTAPRAGNRLSIKYSFFVIRVPTI